MVSSRFLWIKKSVPNIEPPRTILAIEVPLPEKMAAFILSDLPPPLQKHHDSPKTPICIWKIECVRVPDPRVKQVNGNAFFFDSPPLC